MPDSKVSIVVFQTNPCWAQVSSRAYVALFCFVLFCLFVCLFFLGKKEKDRRDGYWYQTYLVNVKFTDNVIEQSVQVI